MLQQRITLYSDGIVPGQKSGSWTTSLFRPEQHLSFKKRHFADDQFMYSPLHESYGFTKKYCDVSRKSFSSTKGLKENGRK